MTTAKPYTPQWYADLMDRTQSRYCEADLDQLRNAVDELRTENERLTAWALEERDKVHKFATEVERLRDQDSMAQNIIGGLNRQIREVKAEIERLRLDACAYANVMLSEENDALIEDNKRLRALLKAVVQEADRSTRAFNEARALLGEGKG